MTLDEDALKARLAQAQARRGYLLPHHGLLAVSAPRLLDAYDAAYTELALADRSLSRHDREFVWLAILLATGEALATHHVAKFREAGGTHAEIETILAVSALAIGAEAYRFAERAWAPHLPGFDVRAAWSAALSRAAGEADMRLVRLATSAALACRAAWESLRGEIESAYAEGVPEDEMAEALSLVMFPASVPNFVQACRVWRDLILEGAVQPSLKYRLWAEMSGQGGFDEASGASDEAKSAPPPS